MTQQPEPRRYRYALESLEDLLSKHDWLLLLEALNLRVGYMVATPDTIRQSLTDIINQRKEAERQERIRQYALTVLFKANEMDMNRDRKPL